MEKIILIDKGQSDTRVSLIENGRLAESDLYKQSDNRLMDAIFVGRVEHIVKNLNGAFIDIGLDKNALLSGADNLPKGGLNSLKQGSEIPVQVIKLPGGEKGVLVTSDIKLSGRMCVLLPYTESIGVSKKIEDEQERDRLRALAKKLKPEGMGIILRTNASGKSEEEISADITELKQKWDGIKTRLEHASAPTLINAENDPVSIVYKNAREAQTDKFVFSDKADYERFLSLAKDDLSLKQKATLHTGDISLSNIYSINKQLTSARERKIWLKSGGFLVFDTTEALTVIDVNSGKNTSSKSNAENILALNLEAADEIALQIRLRDTGGIIIIDFIDMASKADKDTLLSHLRENFKSDTDRTNVIDITQLGLAEITRKRRAQA